MTWRELKEKIEEMPEDQKDRPAIACGEETPITDVVLARFDEDMYANDEWDYVEPDGNLSDEDKEDPGTRLVVEKGTYYLFF